MLLKSMPKDLAAEAITKRLENPMKILLMVMIKYQPGGRREREALLSQITQSIAGAKIKPLKQSELGRGRLKGRKS